MQSHFEFVHFENFTANRGGGFMPVGSQAVDVKGKGIMETYWLLYPGCPLPTPDLAAQMPSKRTSNPRASFDWTARQRPMKAPRQLSKRALPDAVLTAMPGDGYISDSSDALGSVLPNKGAMAEVVSVSAASPVDSAAIPTSAHGRNTVN